MNKPTELLPGMQASFDAAVDFQAKPLTISGDADLIIELHDAAEVTVREIQKQKVSTAVAKPAVEAVAQATDVLEGRRATVAAKLYDFTNKTNMYELLKQKRQDERDLRVAQKLGLITSTHCAKHEKALATVRGIR